MCGRIDEDVPASVETVIMFTSQSKCALPCLTTRRTGRDILYSCSQHRVTIYRNACPGNTQWLLRQAFLVDRYLIKLENAFEKCPIRQIFQLQSDRFHNFNPTDFAISIRQIFHFQSDRFSIFNPIDFPFSIR